MIDKKWEEIPTIMTEEEFKKMIEEKKKKEKEIKEEKDGYRMEKEH